MNSIAGLDSYSTFIKFFNFTMARWANSELSSLTFSDNIQMCRV